MTEGTWEEIKGKAKKNIGEMTKNQDLAAEGRREEATGSLQKKSGLPKDEVRRDVNRASR